MMNGAEMVVSSMAAILTSPSVSGDNPSSEPLLSREQALLETFFHCLSHFGHEKAKETVDREREVVKLQLAADLASSSSPAARGSGVARGVSPSKTSLGQRVASPAYQHGSYWLYFLNSLSLLSNVEKDYWNLTFVGGSQTSNSIALSFQTLFSRRKESSLKGDCTAVLNELKRIEVVLTPDEAGAASEIPSNVDGFPSEKLLSHLSEQLQAFIAARLRLIEFYEQMHALSSCGSSSNATQATQARMDKIGGRVASDLIIVLSDVIQSHQKGFHHPILSPLKTIFTTECGILLSLFQGQVEILKSSFLTSLLHLNDAHRRLNDWDAIVTLQAKKGNFASRGITIGPTATKKSGSNVGDPLPLYAWLWKFRASLISKFTFYFYEVFSQQSPSAAEMKTHTAKTDFDFLGKVTNFVKRTDASSVSLIYDSTSQMSYGKGGGRGGGRGYRHPETTASSLQDYFASASSSSGSSPSSPSSPPLSFPPANSGLENYPVVFSFPPESDRHLARCDQNHYTIVISLITHYAFGKTGDLATLSGFSIGESSSSSSSSGKSSLLSDGANAAPQVFSLFEKNLNTTYVVTNVELNFYLVLIFEGKKGEKDSYVASFLEEITTALQLSHVFRWLRPGTK